MSKNVPAFSKEEWIEIRDALVFYTARSVRYGARTNTPKVAAVYAEHVELLDKIRRKVVSFVDGQEVLI